MQVHRLLCPWCGCLLIALAAAGCEGGTSGVFTSLRPAAGGPADRELEAEHRERYQTERDPQALRWLLVHCVRQGMTVADVDAALGQEGEREFDDRKFKAASRIVRADDKTYRWGPDSDGRSVYLIFRDGNLLNYKPEEFDGRD